MMESSESMMIRRVKNCLNKFMLVNYLKVCSKNTNLIFRLICKIKKILFIERRKSQKKKNFKVKAKKLVTKCKMTLKSNVPEMICLWRMKKSILCS